jgi:hypothetical protein
VVVGVVSGVEEVVVQGAVEPVVEELDGARVEQRDEEEAVGAPEREVLAAGQVEGSQVEQDAAEDDLVVPVALPIHLLELDAPVHNLPPAPRVLEPGRRDPRLVVEHPEEQRREDGQVARVSRAPPLGRRQVAAVRHPRRQQQVLHACARATPHERPASSRLILIC